ncbi:MAG: hypothetical protein R3213_12865 [Flavobacteriaceae bacterium]|nr:hypothetical protein [Flavobacteriaceae bacterium]
MVDLLIKLYIIGVCILIVAIIANAVIEWLNIASWYDFIESLQIDGKEAFSKLSLVDYLWLFIFYPLTLGAGYYLGVKLHELIF